MSGYFALMLDKIDQDERKHWAAQLSLRCDMAMEELCGLSEKPHPLDDLVQQLKELKFMASTYAWPGAEYDAKFWQALWHIDLPPADSNGQRLYPGTWQRCKDMRDALKAQFLQASGVQKFQAYKVIDVASDHLIHIASMVEWDECGVIAIHMQQSIDTIPHGIGSVSGIDVGK